MRLTVVTHELPYPADHGGKVDVWNRLRALRRQRVDVQLVVWESATGADSLHLRDVAASVTDLIVVRRNVRRALLWHGRYPPRMLSFVPTGEEQLRLSGRVAGFNPDAVLLDAWPAYLAARRLADDLARPLLYRSHNVEHLYLADQASLARGAQRWKIRLNLLGFARLESRIRSSASAVFDICQEDIQFWQQRGQAANARELPPSWEDEVQRSPEAASKDIDVLFAGNLWTPNNVDGLHWFLSSVLPRVAETSGERLRITFAGSNPKRALVEACAKAGVDCIPNPVEMATIIRRARVHINPVRRTSGVNMKLLPLLAGDGAIVVTPEALRGLPGEIRQFCRVAKTPEAFAEAIRDALNEGAAHDAAARRAALRQHFGDTRIQSFISAIQGLTKGRGIAPSPPKTAAQ